LNLINVFLYGFCFWKRILLKIIRIVFELDFGGVEKVIQLTAAYFQSDPDIQHEVLVLGKGGRTEHQILEQGDLVEVLDANPKIPNIKLVFWLRDYFKKHRPDVVHTVGAEANFHGLWAAWLAGLPVRIGEEIGFPNHHFLYRVLFKLTYRCAHQVISVSEAVRDHLVQIGEIKKKKSIVVYNPVALECPDLMPEKADTELHFIMVSRLTAIKNIPAVLKALAEIIKETAQTDYCRRRGRKGELPTKV